MSCKISVHRPAVRSKRSVQSVDEDTSTRLVRPTRATQRPPVITGVLEWAWGCCASCLRWGACLIAVPVTIDTCTAV